METRNSMSLLFFIKKTKLLQNGKAPIYLRITVNSKRVEIALKISIDVDKWSSDAGMAKQNYKEAKIINKHLDSIRVKLHHNFRQLINEGDEVTAISLKNSFLGIKRKGKTIVSIFKEHNEGLKKLVGIDYVLSTVTRYDVSLNYLIAFMQKRSGLEDIEMSRIDYKFVYDYELFLKTEIKIAQNTVMKHMKMFKKVIRFAISKELIRKDPFANYKMKFKKVDRGYLSDEELDILLKLKFKDQKTTQVIDCFLFSCFTGLAYSDFKKLKLEDIVTGTDGNKWIKINRKKTNVKSSIPILPITQKIIDKYRNDPYCLIHNVLLPVLSNQKMNNYLKEIAETCGITKRLTCHLARHTFATTVTLNNNVPIESVSKMLGHSSINMTKVYARLLDKKVSHDMSKLHDIYK